jgi:pyruvate kinase
LVNYHTKMANPFFTKLQNNPTCYLRKCKIISTLGVQHSSLESIQTLVDAGTDAFRIPIPSDACTIAHLDTMVTNIRQVSEQTGKPLPIIASFHDLDFGIDSGTSKPRALEKGDYI